MDIAYSGGNYDSNVCMQAHAGYTTCIESKDEVNRCYIFHNKSMTNECLHIDIFKSIDRGCNQNTAQSNSLAQD